MILNKGLWISITLDGIEASISQTLQGHAFLTLYGPEREVGNPWSAYTPFGGMPSADDESPFAVLYKKLESIAKEIGLEGPYGDDHPAVFRRFEFIHKESPTKLLDLLSTHGIVIKVTVMDHKGDDAEVETAKQDFSRWIDGTTVYKPNPKIEEERKRVEEKRYWDKHMKEAEKKDAMLRNFVFIPITVLVLIASVLCLVTGHWLVAILIILCPIILYVCFVLWIMLVLWIMPRS